MGHRISWHLTFPHESDALGAVGAHLGVGVGALGRVGAGATGVHGANLARVRRGRA